MQQVIVIHGGDSFDTYDEYLDSLKNQEVSLETFLPHAPDWRRNLQIDIGDEFQILMPEMPNSKNARYIEWKIWFERILPFLSEEVILVGHSQGAVFLSKYLSENNFSTKIKGLLLVAAPHNHIPEIGDFRLAKPLGMLRDQCANIHLFHSKDDKVVPFSELSEYQKELPTAKTYVFDDRGHFNQEHFPELVEVIRN